MDDLSIPQRFAVWVLPVIFAVTVHEVAHGWVASRLGDNTAKNLGRLTLNPIKHIDPIGTILVPAVLLYLGGFLFGWAKPVPVNWHNLKNPKKDMILVALAGPGANLIMAILWALVIKLGFVLADQNPTIGMPLIYTGYAGIFINLILMTLNLLPIPPLDGSRVLAGFLPNQLAYQFSKLERWGFPILVALIALGWLGKLIGPPIYYMLVNLMSIIGVPIQIMHLILSIIGVQ